MYCQDSTVRGNGNIFRDAVFTTEQCQTNVRPDAHSVDDIGGYIVNTIDD